MKIDLIIGNSSTLYYPAVEDGVTLEWDRKGSPGKLRFCVVRDEVLKVEEGDAVKLAVDGTELFYGFVFTKSSSGRSRQLLDVTAYDQLRYFKNKDTYVYTNKTAGEVIRMIADDFRLHVGTIADTHYVIPSRTEDNVSLFDIVQSALDETLKAETKLYVLYDDVGAITLRDAESMKLNLVVNAGTAGDYAYTSSIDTQTYNQIKVVCENGDKRRIFIAKDGSNINRWGLLQYTDTVESAASGAKKSRCSAGSV